MRRQRLEKSVANGKFKGEKKEKMTEKYPGAVTKWHGEKAFDLVGNAKDRIRCRNIIANSTRLGT